MMEMNALWNTESFECAGSFQKEQAENEVQGFFIISFFKLWEITGENVEGGSMTNFWKEKVQNVGSKGSKRKENQ